jgi:hypothetical protein
MSEGGDLCITESFWDTSWSTLSTKG